MEADNSGISRDLCKNKDNLHLVSGTSMLVSREAGNVELTLGKERKNLLVIKICCLKSKNP